MADDVLHQFYVHAARTFSIAHEVFQVLKRNDKADSKNAITRLELELATWQAEIATHETYQTALSEYNSAYAAWKHSGRAGSKPEKPSTQWPSDNYDDIDEIFDLFGSLIRQAGYFRESLDGKSWTSSPEHRLSVIRSDLELMGETLDGIKDSLDGDGEENEYDADEADEELSQFADPPAIVPELGDPDQLTSTEQADDPLRSFYARALNTLSIAYKVHEELCRHDRATAADTIARLRHELDSWQPDMDAVSRYYADEALSRHLGSIGVSPKVPAWPAHLPTTGRINKVFRAIIGFRMDVLQVQHAIDGSMSESILARDLEAMVSHLGTMGESLDGLKEEIENDAANDSTPEEITQQTEPSAIVDGLVAVDQMARLAGITVPALNNRLSKSRPRVTPISPGGRKHNAYPWPEIRDWMLEHWPNRTLPKDFDELQRVLGQLTDTA